MVSDNRFCTFSDAGMSVDGDLQGVPRILDALSAHMWPGLVMKSTLKLTDVQPDSKENDEGAECLHFSCWFLLLFTSRVFFFYHFIWYSP